MSPRPPLSSITLKALAALSLGLPLISSCQDPASGAELDEEPPDLPPDPMLDERRQIARGGSRLFSPTAMGDFQQATAEQMAAALDIPPNLLAAASSTQGPEPSMGVFTDSWGVVTPLRGDSFTVLSTGVIQTRPEPGTDMVPLGVEGDSVSLEVELDIPEGMTRLSFYYNFMSSESPDYVAAGFNDAFTATLIEPDGTEHVIVSASVDDDFGPDSEYHDISRKTVEGTGFDIVAYDPGGVDYETGTIPATEPDAVPEPDAGVTGFQQVDFALPVTGNVRLVFEIHDAGDGILDSAVILDGFRVRAMDVLSLVSHGDAGAQSLIDGGIISDNIGELAALTSDRAVRGVVADGATRVLLRTRVPGPGTVEYSVLRGDVASDGGVSALNGAVGATALITAEQDATGQYWAFATYSAPTDFVRDMVGVDDTVASQRQAEVRATFTPDGAGMPLFEDTQELVIRRPPVVLINGIWSDMGKWQASFLDSFQPEDARFSFHRVMGFGRNDTGVAMADHLSFEPNTTIRNALIEMEDDFIAASQVDLIAHGVGGLLARQYLGEDDSAVNKLITLNTPHNGSAFAREALVMYLNGTPPPNLLDQMETANAGVAVGGGVLLDIQENSEFLANLGPVDVPSHVIVGTGGETLPYPINDANIGQEHLGHIPWYTFIRFSHPSSFLAQWFHPINMINGLFPGMEGHDLFSTTNSQLGGLGVGDPAVTLVTHNYIYDNANPGDRIHEYSGMHTWVPGGRGANAIDDVTFFDYSTRLVQLLNAQTDSELFATGLPAPDVEGAPMIEGPLGESPAIAFSVVGNGLTILSPTEGEQIEPGATLDVTVGADPGLQIDELWLFGSTGFDFVIDPVFPVTLSFPVADDAAGEVSLFAVGFNTNGEVFTSSDIDLGATPVASLVDLRLYPRTPVLFGVGATLSATVYGLYDDGVDRNVTSAVAGTVYGSSNNAVFTVSSDGVVTANGIGKATLTARNGDILDSVTVDVRVGVQAGFGMITEWNGGYCASLRVSNNTTQPTSDWSVTMDMGDSIITEIWNGVTSGMAGTVTVEPEHDWQLAIPSGATKSYTGFCANRGPSNESLPSVVSVSASF